MKQKIVLFLLLFGLLLASEGWAQPAITRNTPVKPQPAKPKPKPANPAPSKPIVRSFGEYSTTPIADEVVDIVGVKVKMIGVQGGTFTMGATPEQGSDARKAERPAHPVALSSFKMSETVVTQELWLKVMERGSYDPGPSQKPAYLVTWTMAQEFISKLNAMTGRKFRLPTEAEWEYAARGGVKSQGYKYPGSNNPDEVAWTEKTIPKHIDEKGNTWYITPEVKGLKPNELGFYDMAGLVEELCQDYYGPYSASWQTNPKGPATGRKSFGQIQVVSRGARSTWTEPAGRVSMRYSSSNNSGASYGYGFRLVLDE